MLPLPDTLHVSPGGPLSGTLDIPGDKSITHRALLCSAIAEGNSLIHGALISEDTLATAKALEALGIAIQFENTTIQVQSRGLSEWRPPSNPLDMGNSGTSMRLLSGLLAGQDFESILTGDNSLLRRPMQRIITPLRAMGATVTARDGKAPLVIQGRQPLNPIDYALPIASAQVKSCLLLAAIQAKGWSRIHEPSPTRDHTERLLKSWGYPIYRENQTLLIHGRQPLIPQNITVPGDFSSAAFFILGACISPGSEILLKHVGINPLRIGFVSILKAMGAHIEIHPSTQHPHPDTEPVGDIYVRYNHPLHGIDVPLPLVANAIDEFPALFIAAALAQGETVIRGASELRIKESDRLSSMVRGLRSLGIEIEEFPDGAKIIGGNLNGGTVDSVSDHRVAMAFAMASLGAQTPITLRHCQNIATSFPNFLQCAQNLGLNISAGAS